jgi:hypothetical protein
VKVTVEGPTLLAVIDFDALVTPTRTVPKLSAVGDSEIDCPVPDRATVWGVFGALSLNVSVPLRAPFAVGLKVTLTEQFAPAAKVAPQVLVEMW